MIGLSICVTKSNSTKHILYLCILYLEANHFLEPKMRQNDKQSTPKRRSQRLIEAKEPKKERRLNPLIEAKAPKKKRRPSPEITIRQNILALPTEILLLIIKNLSLSWKFSLALTCKSWTELIHRSTLPRLDKYELMEFLLTLKRDIPNVFFCHCCYKLCQFDPNLDWKSQAHASVLSDSNYFYWLPHKCSTQHVCLPERFYHFMSDTEISFMEANLVMRRHFHGFSQGISLQSLERHESFEDIIEFGKCVEPSYSQVLNERKCVCFRKQWATRSKTKNKAQLPGDNFIALQQRKNTWRFLFRSIPKIIDNKLYIARFFTINGPLVSERSLKKVIGSMSISICRHLTCTAYPSCCHRKHSSPERYLCSCPSIQSRWPILEQGQAVEFDPEQDSCWLCSTDYRISLDRGISDNETNLNISIYHCLGSCQFPNDELWMPFARRYQRWQKVSTRALESDRGNIQREWHEAAWWSRSGCLWHAGYTSLEMAVWWE